MKDFLSKLRSQFLPGAWAAIRVQCMCSRPTVRWHIIVSALLVRIWREAASKMVRMHLRKLSCPTSRRCCCATPSFTCAQQKPKGNKTSGKVRDEYQNMPINAKNSHCQSSAWHWVEQLENSCKGSRYYKTADELLPSLARGFQRYYDPN